MTIITNQFIISHTNSTLQVSALGSAAVAALGSAAVACYTHLLFPTGWTLERVHTVVYLGSSVVIYQ